MNVRLTGGSGARGWALRIALAVAFGSGGAGAAHAQTCGFVAGGTLGNVINTYYPGTSVNAARTQVTVDAANRFPAANPAIAAGDMVLIIQMQDSEIDARNDSRYGDGAVGAPGSGVTNLNNSGLYEYAVATSAPNGAGTFGVAGANPSGDGSLLRQYFTDLTVSGTRGRRTFQVVRVPQYGSATLGSTLTASAWNGRAGGVLALDVSGTLALGNATVSVDGLGFRGGVGRARGGTAGLANTDYRTSVALNPNGMKGEGIVGTPDLAGTNANGYPNGDMARGAPGTAGGGGTDGNPANANDQNTGGGGGANWGAGGQGGHGWLQNDCPPATGSQTGGFGGAGVQDATRLLPGSGGGAGSRNNAGPSSAGNGGGMILVRAGAVTGTGTLLARGTRPLSTANDGAGGGGAGGTIVVVAATGNLNNLAADASGAGGGYANLASPPAPDPPPGTQGSHHGPGGGGGGGRVRLSALPTSAINVAGGLAGFTNTCAGGNVTQTYGATNGGAGSAATNWTLASLAGVRLCTLVTRATLVGWSADASGRLEFVTGSQRRTRGFNVYGSEDAAGPEGEPLNPELIPAAQPDSNTPSFYRADLGALPPYLWIEEVETDGSSRFLGPLDRDDERSARAFEGIRARVGEAESRREVAQARRARRAWARSTGEPRPARGRSGSRSTSSRPGVAALKIEVEATGVAHVSLEELRAAGFPEGARGTRAPRLTRLGQPLPFRLDESGLTFEAEALSTDYTDRSPYVLAWGSAAPTPRVSLTRSELPRRPGFVRVEENRFYAPYLPRDTDPWIWDVAVAGFPGAPWTFDLPGLRVGGPGVSVRLRLVGGTAHRHQVEVRVNGAAAGRAEWSGVAARVIEGVIPAGVLRETGNTLELGYEASGDVEGVGLLYLDALDLRAPVAPPAAPVAPVRIVAFDPDVDLAGADYLVLTPGAFRAAADVVAAAKRAEGRSPAVVDVERAYDRYSAGVLEPEAVHALLRDAHKRGVRDVLLLGDDTLDPRGFLGDPPEAFLPSLVGWDGEFGRVPSENRYADVTGDGRPDLAIGRLPARTPEEADLLADKVARQAELLARGEGRHLFAADRSAPLDSPFREAASAMAARHFAGREVALVDAAEGAAAARSAVLEALRGGAAAVHYFGHGGPEAWSGTGLLTAADAAGLEGTGAGALVLTWACEVQWYQYHLGPSVNEALLLARDGGAVAAFGPAGISNPSLQRGLYDRLYSWLQRGSSLGEAVRRAKAEALAADPRAVSVVEGFNLLGDPAFRLPAGSGPAAVLR